MTEYVVLLTDDQSAWATATDEEKAAAYEMHGRFAALLAERGHRVTGGDLEDLVECTKVLSAVQQTIEIRPTEDHSEDQGGGDA